MTRAPLSTRPPSQASSVPRILPSLSAAFRWLRTCRNRCRAARYPGAFRERTISRNRRLSPGPLAHQSHIGRGKDHRGQPAQSVTQSFRLISVQGDLLLLSLRLEGGGHFHPVFRAHTFKGSHHPKEILTKGNQTIIPRSSEGPESLEVVDGLEEIRLSLSVFADDGDAFGWEVQLLVGQVPEVPDWSPLRCTAGGLEGSLSA